ncbi:MAG: hypothetical protein DU429_06395 [Candidatus Tokpelaia sp.]|nr:MAG: hypothetical protein DU430_01775 [Candidatus Tokpelaia sp.]KAA6206345.1 MAG: hypothetical protein DU429_06395 [Candidatus Tokpelaia sp.]
MTDSALFKITLYGESAREGAVDIACFAPLLTAIDQMLQSANAEIYGKENKIIVNLCATEKGSFLAIFTVAAQNIAFFATEHNQEIAAINQLLDMLLKCGTLGGGTLALLKFLKGKKPDKIEHKGGDIYIHSGDIFFKTTPASFNLSQKPKIRKAVKNLLLLRKERELRQ